MSVFDPDDGTEEHVIELDVTVDATDGWCAKCALPSLVTLRLVTILPEGVATAGTMSFCADELEADA